MSYKFCAKGSKKLGEDFKKETLEILKICSFLEVNCNFPQLTNFDNELKFLLEIKKDKGVSYVIHAPYLNSSLADLNPKLRLEAIKEIFLAIDRAEYLGSNLVTIHPAFDPYGIYFKEREIAEIDSYKRIADYALGRNILIGLENEAQTCFFFPDRTCRFELIKKIVEKVGCRNFGYTIDTGHGNISGIDLNKSIREASDKLFHIHAHDNFGREDLHLAPGEGNIRWKSIFEALEKIKYNHLIEIETEVDKIPMGMEFLSNATQV